MSKTLSNNEIKQRLIKLANLEKLHTAQLKRNERQSIIIKEQKEHIKTQGEEIKILKKLTQTLKLQIEELQQMVFGKKKHKDFEEKTDDDEEPPETSQKRNNESYKRELPKEGEVTETNKFKIVKCPDCKNELKRRETKVFYIEDIQIPKKLVVKNEAEKGFCSKCRKWHSNIQIPTSNIILGETVRLHISYQSVILRLSRKQIQNDLKNTFNLNISLGEIDKILERKGEYHSIDYERLKKVIQKEKVLHFDETGDRVRDGDGYKAYTWLMQGMNKSEVFFKMGKTRGRGNAEKMLGDSNAVKTSRLSRI